MGDTPLEKILESSMSSESSSCKYISEMVRPRLSGEPNGPRMGISHSIVSVAFVLLQLGSKTFVDVLADRAG